VTCPQYGIWRRAVNCADRQPSVEEAMMTRYEGGCSCGAVRFTVHGEPVQVGVCHCTTCRKATGTAFLHYADWMPENFTTTGEFATYDGRSFCPRCGSRLFHISEDGVEINLGSLDIAPTNLKPIREGWIVRREPWLAAVHGAVQADGDPPKAQH
jgi:hypothetical protein